MLVTRFDPAHEYRDETGRIWPSVTGILGAVPPWLGRYDRIPPDVLEYKRQLGTAVHHATALDDQGLLDETTVCDAIVPYLEAWRRYRAESGFTPLTDAIERVVWHEALGYAGALDRVGLLRSGRWLLPDVKSSDPSTGSDAGPQTAAYLEAYRSHGPLLPARIDRCSVHLQDDGTYRVVPHTNRRDFNVFCAALELFNFNAQRR
jgi:hypothetical protein